MSSSSSPNASGDLVDDGVVLSAHQLHVLVDQLYQLIGALQVIANIGYDVLKTKPPV